MRPLLLALGLFALATPSTSSAAYTIQRSTVAATGGSAAGGPFKLNYTVGHLVAGAHSGGTHALTSGFWWQVSGGVVNVVEPSLPSRFHLNPGVPNPFGTHTVIRFAVPEGEPAQITLTVHDIRGATVRTLVRDRRPAGTYSMDWDGRNDSGHRVGAGMYFVRFEGPGFRQHHRIVALQ